MIETKDLTKFAQHIFSHGRGAGRVPALYPEREWFIITTLFLAVFLAGAVMSVWYYRVYQTLPQQVAGREALTVPAYQAEAVAQAQEVYQERENRYQSLLDSAALSSAPSPPPADETEVNAATSSAALATSSPEVLQSTSTVDSNDLSTEIDE